MYLPDHLRRDFLPVKSAEVIPRIAARNELRRLVAVAKGAQAGVVGLANHNVVNQFDFQKLTGAD
jgi:hypothetical protein